MGLRGTPPRPLGGFILKYLLRDKINGNIWDGLQWRSIHKNFVITECAAYTSKQALICDYKYQHYLAAGKADKNIMNQLEVVKVKGVNAYEILS